MTERREWRVVWKREGRKEKNKRYRTHAGAARWIQILGPEPWTAFGGRPDDYMCCSGNPDSCGCGGMTWKEHWEEKRLEIPKLEWTRIESRTVGPWEVESDDEEKAKA